MKKILFLLSFILYNLTIVGQVPFRYTKYIRGYWDDHWESTYKNWGGQHGESSYVIKGSIDDFIIYIPGCTPADFTTHIKINNFNLNINKKEKKSRLKDNKWYEYTGVMEFYFDPNVDSIEKWLRKFPTVPNPNWSNAEKRTIPVQVMIAPYKDKPETYIIIVNSYLRLGISSK